MLKIFDEDSLIWDNFLKQLENFEKFLKHLLKILLIVLAVLSKICFQWPMEIGHYFHCWNKYKM